MCVCVHVHMVLLAFCLGIYRYGLLQGKALLRMWYLKMVREGGREALFRQFKNQFILDLREKHLR